jgi:predicted AAA+ superfamily ATPase
VLEDLIEARGILPVNTLYVNFEDPKFSSNGQDNILQFIVDAYRGFFHPEGRIYLVLDEIQMVPQWERWVTSVHDRREDVKIFVTGSSSALMSEEFATLLTGRHLEMEVFPLDLAEFLQFNDHLPSDPVSIIADSAELKGYTNEFIQRGGFPRVVLEPNDNVRAELLRQTYYDILHRDIVTRFHIKDARKLEALASYYMTNIANSMSYSATRKALSPKISLDTIDRFTGYFSSSFLFSFVPFYAFSLKEQMAMPRKVYAIDNGLRQEVSFRFSGDRGRLLENRVYLDLRRENQDIFSGIGPSGPRFREHCQAAKSDILSNFAPLTIYYWRGRTETDFVLRQDDEIKELINVCLEPAAPETMDRELKSMAESMLHFDKDEGLVITLDFEDEIIKNGRRIVFRPYWKWRLMP